MTSDQLRSMRQGFNLTQAAMAAMMGMPLRTYEDLERGRAEMRGIHTRAAEMAAIYVVIANPTVASAMPRELWPVVSAVFQVGREAGLLPR